MGLRIQGPGTSSLLSELSNPLPDCTFCGAVFAFATSEGINRFFASNRVVDLLSRQGRLQLFIGMDAITSTSSLKTLERHIGAREELIDAVAIINDDARYIFNPKFVWFDWPDNLRVIVGSGNLTLAGLGNQTDEREGCNWEAFSVEDYQGEARDAALAEIDAWIERMRQAGSLYALSDQLVADAGVENSRLVPRRRRTGLRTGARPDRPVGGPGAPQEEANDYAVIREISSNREGQADVGERAIKLFGYVEGEERSAITQPVFSDNHLGAASTRRVFKNASSNYRIELEGLKGESVAERGDNDERAILVVVKFDESASRYCIVPITSEVYETLSELLGEIPSTGRRLMRARFFSSADELEHAWPGAFEPLRLRNETIVD